MIAFIFPGQGSQRVGMGQAFAAADPIVRDTFAEADAALGAPLSRLCFEGPESELTLTENTQPAILTVSVAIARVLEARGWRPDFYAGHSLGEYSAHVAAGTFAFADAVRTVRNRGRYMQEAVPVGTGAMAAILGLDGDAVAAACAEAANGDVVSPANLNAPGQVVIAGEKEAVNRAIEACKARGAKRAMPLPVSAPFHSTLMKPAAAKLETYLAKISVSTPEVSVVNNVDVAIETSPERIKQALVRQAASPVRWVETIRKMADAGVTHIVECGPGKVLAGMTKRIAPGVKSFAAADRASLEEALKC